MCFLVSSVPLAVTRKLMARSNVEGNVSGGQRRKETAGGAISKDAQVQPAQEEEDSLNTLTVSIPLTLHHLFMVALNIKLYYILLYYPLFLFFYLLLTTSRVGMFVGRN